MPDESSTKPLSQYCDANMQSLGRETPTEFRFRYIDLSSVNQGNIDWQKTRALTYANSPSRARRVVKPGDVLFSTVRPGLMGHGMVREPTDLPVIGSTGFAVLSPKEGVDGRFLFHSLFLDEFKRQVAQFEVGSNYPAINESDLLRVKLGAVAGPSQRLIADVLDAMDEAILESDAVIEKLTTLRLGIIEDLCGIETLSFKARQDVGEFLQWENGPLGQWLQGIEQGWSPDCEDEPAPGGSWGILKTTAVVWSGWNYRKNKRLPDGLQPRPSLTVRTGDILMTRAGPDHRVGVVAYVHETQEKLMLSDKLYRLIPKHDFRPDFLAMLLSTSNLQKQISSFKVGMAQSQMNIAQSDVKKLAVIKPPLKYQASAVAGVASLDSKLRAEVINRSKLYALRLALRDDLLTGRKPVVAIREAAE